jgi:hypothetical protein
MAKIHLYTVKTSDKKTLKTTNKELAERLYKEKGVYLECRKS